MTFIWSWIIVHAIVIVDKNVAFGDIKTSYNFFFLRPCVFVKNNLNFAGFTCAMVLLTISVLDSLYSINKSSNQIVVFHS